MPSTEHYSPPPDLRGDGECSVLNKADTLISYYVRREVNCYNVFHVESYDIDVNDYCA